MAENIIVGASPELAAEIERGLDELRKKGYTAEVQNVGGDGGRVRFTFGESEQTLEFNRDEWEKSGAVSQKIVDHLNI